MSPRPTKVLLDTNFLLLWLVAKTDPKLLSSFKRVQMFTPQDIELLRRSVQSFRQQITTPHILSEVSNFIDQAPVPYRNALTDEFRLFIQRVAEVFRPAEFLIERVEFNALGLTDVGVLELSNEALVVSIDFKLVGKILAIGGNAVNFNLSRSAGLLKHRP